MELSPLRYAGGHAASEMVFKSFALQRGLLTEEFFEQPGQTIPYEKPFLAEKLVRMVTDVLHSENRSFLLISVQLETFGTSSSDIGKLTETRK